MPPGRGGIFAFTPNQIKAVLDLATQKDATDATLSWPRVDNDW